MLAYLYRWPGRNRVAAYCDAVDLVCLYPTLPLDLPATAAAYFENATKRTQRRQRILGAVAGRASRVSRRCDRNCPRAARGGAGCGGTTGHVGASPRGGDGPGVLPGAVGVAMAERSDVVVVAGDAEMKIAAPLDLSFLV